MKNNENDNKIEVVIGDGSALNISEVNDCMNSLRPKGSEKNKKQVIIPTSKKKTENSNEDDLNKNNK